MSVAALTRIFRAGTLQLADIDPSMTPEEIRDLYAVNFPHLRNATVQSPTEEGGELVFCLVPAPVKTKG